MPPQDPNQLPPPVPIPPTPPVSGDGNILDAPDPKKNPYKGHIARPDEVPLAKPEFTPIEAAQAKPEHPYSFIMDADKKPKTATAGADSMIKRIGLVAGGLLVLVILFSVFRGIVSPGPDFSGVITTAEQQQEMIHILASAIQQPSLTTQNMNFALTAKLSLGSSEGKLVSYLKKNGTTIDTKSLNSKISATIDSQLTAAAANNSYNQTFQTLLQSQLGAYMQGLKKAYQEDKGKVGRQLLTSDYNQAQLLLTQLASPAS